MWVNSTWSHADMMHADVNWPYPFRWNTRTHTTPECHFIHGTRFTFGSCCSESVHTHTLCKFFPSNTVLHLIMLANEEKATHTHTEYASMLFKYFLSIVKCDAFTVECTHRIKTLSKRDNSRTHAQHIDAHQASSLFPVGLSLKFSFVWTNVYVLAHCQFLLNSFILFFNSALLFELKTYHQMLDHTHQHAILFRNPENCN